MLTDWGRQAILQTQPWLPARDLIFVADSSFAAIELIKAVRQHACLITRLRLEPNLSKPARKRHLGQRGRPRLKGRHLPKLSAVLDNPKAVRTTTVVSQ